MPPKNTRRAPAAPQPRQRTISRTPVAIDERRRWPVALWSALTCAWLIGSPLFLVLYLAEGFALLNATEITDTARRTTALYLTGLVAAALGAPLAGALTAALLRRRIAAALFTLALLASAGALFTLASPAEILAGIRGGLG
ncbi:MAG: hypothetical protein M0026_09030 [Nocardiopsaceae bacterium]|nr:hypothetical protein [Nocardiopsaceae bacterium]